MRIIHLSDIHAADQWLDECKKCCEFVLQKAKNEPPDLIVVAGDVFDSRDIKLDSPACKYIFQFMHNLSEIAPLAIVSGTPIHEGHATENLAFASAFEHNVKVSTMPEQLYLHRGQLTPLELIGGDINFGCQEKKPDAIISMLPTPTKQWMQGTDDQISQALTPIFAGFGATAAEFDCPHLLVYHGTIAGATLANGQEMTGRDISISKDQLALGKFDLVCCGHIHLPQEIKPNIVYSGSLFAKNFGEDHDHGFYIHELAKNRPTIEPVFQKYSLLSQFIKTPSRALVNLKLNMVEDDLSASDINLLDIMEVKDKDVKVSIKVYQDEAASVSKENIVSVLKSSGASNVTVDIKYIPREVVRSERMAQLETLADKFNEQAKLKSEELPIGISQIADDLETLTEEDIYEKVTAGYTYGADAGALG